MEDKITLNKKTGKYETEDGKEFSLISHTITTVIERITREVTTITFSDGRDLFRPPSTVQILSKENISRTMKEIV